MMLRDPCSLEDAVLTLNEALRFDPKAITELIDHRVPCNPDLADHATIQTMPSFGANKVGLLGILNGIFGTASDGRGPIAAIYDDAGRLVRFEIRR
jgi:hypothetical protein